MMFLVIFKETCISVLDSALISVEPIHILSVKKRLDPFLNRPNMHAIRTLFSVPNLKYESSERSRTFSHQPFLCKLEQISFTGIQLVVHFLIQTPSTLQVSYEINRQRELI